MEDYKNIIYIIIGVGWFLFRAYQKSQQKQAKSSGPKPDSQVRTTTDSRHKPKARTLEDIILEQFGQRPEPVLEPEVERAVAVPKAVTVSKNEDKFLHTDLTHQHLTSAYRMSDSESGRHRVQRQIAHVEIEDYDVETLADQLFPSGVDLRQLIVLNAILQRPYS